MAIIKGTIGADILLGTAQADQFTINNTGDSIIGGTLQDTVVSTVNSYTLADGLGNLILGSGAIAGFGNNYNNIVSGNLRNNTIGGGAGQDELWGGAGRDTFVFSHFGDLHADQIQDFEAGLDKIVLRGSDFGLAAGTVLAYELNRQAQGVGPTILRYGSAGTSQAIYLDRDGAGGEKAQLLCTLQTWAGATSAFDFAIV